MGNKYYSIRLITGVFISVLFLSILYNLIDQNLMNPSLESETVWKSTHRLAAKLWLPGGLLIVACGFIFDEQTTLIIFFMVTTIIALIPIIYSYL